MREQLPLNRLIYANDSGHPQIRLGRLWVDPIPARTLVLGVRNVAGCSKAPVARIWNPSYPRVAHNGACQRPRSYFHPRSGVLPTRWKALWKDFGRDVALECLETLRATEGLTVGAAYRRGETPAFAQTKQQAYTAWVDHFERQFAVEKTLGLMFMDWRRKRQWLPCNASNATAGSSTRH